VKLAFHLTCERLIPKYVRDKLLGGITPFEQLGPNSVACTFGGRDATVVSVSCDNWDDAELARVMEHGKAMKKVKSVRDVTGVGRMAWQGDGSLVGIPMKVLRFWDDDTPCYADVDAKRTWNVELAKALVTSINPDSIR
jgi:hypothetical protein